MNNWRFLDTSGTIWTKERWRYISCWSVRITCLIPLGTPTPSWSFDICWTRCLIESERRTCREAKAINDDDYIYSFYQTSSHIITTYQQYVEQERKRRTLFCKVVTLVATWMMMMMITYTATFGLRSSHIITTCNIRIWPTRNPPCLRLPQWQGALCHSWLHGPLWLHGQVFFPFDFETYPWRCPNHRTVLQDFNTTSGRDPINVFEGVMTLRMPH